jgi:hypothetical protein
MSSGDAPRCSRCGESLHRDEVGMSVYPEVPGWACLYCAGVFDVTKLDLPH